MFLKNQYVTLFYDKKQLGFLRKLKLINLKFGIRFRKKSLFKKRLIKIIKNLNKYKSDYPLILSNKTLKCKKNFWFFFSLLYKGPKKTIQFYFFNRKKGLFDYLSLRLFLKLKLVFFFILLRYNFLKPVIIFRNYCKNFLKILNIFRYKDIDFFFDYFIKKILVLFFVNFDYQHDKIFKKFSKNRNSRIFWFYNRLLVAKKRKAKKRARNFKMQGLFFFKKKLNLTARLVRYVKNSLKKKLHYNVRKFKKYKLKESFTRLKNILIYEDFFTLTDINSSFLKLKPIFVSHKLHFFGRRLNNLLNRRKLSNKKKRILYKSNNLMKILKVLRRFMFFKYRQRFTSFIVKRIRNIILYNNKRDNYFIEKSKTVNNKILKPSFFSSYLNFILSKQNIKVTSHYELFFNFERRIFLETIL